MAYATSSALAALVPRVHSVARHKPTAVEITLTPNDNAETLVTTVPTAGCPSGCTISGPRVKPSRRTDRQIGVYGDRRKVAA